MIGGSVTFRSHVGNTANIPVRDIASKPFGKPRMILRCTQCVPAREHGTITVWNILNVQQVCRLGKLTRKTAIGKSRMYRGYVPAVFWAGTLRVNPGCTYNETRVVNSMGKLGMFLKITGSENCRYAGRKTQNLININLPGLLPVHCAFPYNVPAMYWVGKLGFVPSESTSIVWKGW